MSLIEVICPHCGAKGRIMAPPVGTIVFGPCPECQEMVAIFCGQALPLDKEIMGNGGEDEKKEHLLETLGGFLQDRIEHMFQADGDLAGLAEAVQQSLQKAKQNRADAENEDDSRQVPLEATQPHHRARISEAELDTFRNIELKLIDNKEYFRAVFS